MIPPKANAAFVAAMEDVLEVYTRPHNPARPLVCLDETSKQLVAETRTPLPMQPGLPARYDYEYERNGTASLFMLFAPLEGWRHVKVTERRTAVDYAQNSSSAMAGVSIVSGFIVCPLCLRPGGANWSRLLIHRCHQRLRGRARGSWILSRDQQAIADHVNSPVCFL